MPEPTSSPDRHLRAIADTVGAARARTAGDAHDPGIPTAATVVIARDGDAGPEVLLLLRPDRGSFAGAWVFPGGKIDDADRAGLGAGASEEDYARVAAARETLEETGLVVAGDALTTLSVWDPPPGIELRIRTWFFVAPDPGGEIVLSPNEAVASVWLSPADALARHGRGALPLYPPTWVTLDALAGAADVGALVDTVRARGIGRYETVARRGDDGAMLLWAGDADYGLGDPAPPSGRHRLRIGALPWIYERTDAEDGSATER